MLLKTSIMGFECPVCLRAFHRKSSFDYHAVQHGVTRKLATTGRPSPPSAFKSKVNIRSAQLTAAIHAAKFLIYAGDPRASDFYPHQAHYNGNINTLQPNPKFTRLRNQLTIFKNLIQIVLAILFFFMIKHHPISAEATPLQSSINSTKFSPPNHSFNFSNQQLAMPIRQKLSNFLCHQLNTNTVNLAHLLTTQPTRSWIIPQLQTLLTSKAKLETNHLRTDKAIQFFNFTLTSASTTPAYNGARINNARSVQQHLQFRHNQTLQYPNLPCVTVRPSKRSNHEDYYPMECIDIIFHNFGDMYNNYFTPPPLPSSLTSLSEATNQLTITIPNNVPSTSTAKGLTISFMFVISFLLLLLSPPTSSFRLNYTMDDISEKLQQTQFNLPANFSSLETINDSISLLNAIPSHHEIPDLYSPSLSTITLYNVQQP